MRITFLVNRDLASNVALNLLLPKLVEKHQLTAFYSDQVGTQPDDPSLAMLFFFEHTLLDQLLFPLIDDLSLRGKRLTFDALSTFLTEPMQRLNAPNSPSGIASLKSTNPDLIVSIRYGHILKQSAIDIPHLGVLNLHSGKLPQYRGVMATFRALLAGDAALFSTLHWIDDETIDTGRIISIQGIPTDQDGCYLSNTLNSTYGRTAPPKPSTRFMLGKASKPSDPTVRGTISPSQIATHWLITEQDIAWLIQRCWLRSYLATILAEDCNFGLPTQNEMPFWSEKPKNCSILQ